MKIARSKRHKKIKPVRRRNDDSEEEIVEEITPKKAKKLKESSDKLPRKLQNLSNSINLVKDKSLIKKKKKNKSNKGGLCVKVDKLGIGAPDGRPAITNLPDFVERKKGESKFRFLKRLDSLTEQAMVEASLENQKKTIHIKETTKKQEEEKKKKLKHLRKLKEKKKEKKKLKLQAKEEEERLNFKHLKDNVRFGEVVTAPPVLQPPKEVFKLKEEGGKLDKEQQRLTIVQLYRRLKAEKAARQKALEEMKAEQEAPEI